MIKLTTEKFKEMLKQPGFKVVKFGAIWCSPCRAINKLLKEYETPQNIPIYEIDIDESRELCDEYNITGIPELFIFKNNEVVERISTNLNETTIANIFINYQPWAMTEDEFNRLLNAQTDALTDMELKTFNVECEKRKITNPHI